MNRTSLTILGILATLMLAATIYGQEQSAKPGAPQPGSRNVAGFGPAPTQAPPKPLIPNAKPVRSMPVHFRGSRFINFYWAYSTVCHCSPLFFASSLRQEMYASNAFSLSKLGTGLALGAASNTIAC
jgi:hypothetical protein